MGRPAFYRVEPALFEYEIENNGVALFERKTQPHAVAALRAMRL